jgi:hypothetical protein
MKDDGETEILVRMRRIRVIMQRLGKKTSPGVSYNKMKEKENLLVETYDIKCHDLIFDERV